MPEPRTPQSPESLSWAEWKAQHQQKPWYRRYALAVEWLLEQVNDRLHRWAFIEFLEHVGKFAVLVALIVWALEADDRAKERHYRAWELINSARGSSGDGGRIDALEDLSKDGVSLAAVPLKGAWLQGVDLQGANLVRADIREANLQRADLRRANLQDADLQGAQLQEADLWWADLVWADLRRANLGSFTSPRADLRGADLREANLQGANLREAHLWGADLQGASLVAANLQRANLQDADLQGANLLEAEGLTQEQLDSADGDDKTRLPESLARPAHWTSSKSEGAAE